MMNIDRCVCYQQKFADLKVVANREGCRSLEALQEHIVFGQNCQLCHPYVRRMLETGDTEFSAVIKDPVES